MARREPRVEAFRREGNGGRRRDAHELETERLRPRSTNGALEFVAR